MFPAKKLKFGGGGTSPVKFSIKDLRYGIGGFFEIPTLDCEF